MVWGREIVVKELADYFEVDDVEMSFDDETFVSDARRRQTALLPC